MFFKLLFLLCGILKLHFNDEERTLLLHYILGWWYFLPKGSSFLLKSLTKKVDDVVQCVRMYRELIRYVTTSCGSTLLGACMVRETCHRTGDESENLVIMKCLESEHKNRRIQNSGQNKKCREFYQVEVHRQRVVRWKWVTPEMGRMCLFESYWMLVLMCGTEIFNELWEFKGVRHIQLELIWECL